MSEKLGTAINDVFDNALMTTSSRIAMANNGQDDFFSGNLTQLNSVLSLDTTLQSFTAGAADYQMLPSITARVEISMQAGFKAILPAFNSLTKLKSGSILLLYVKADTAPGGQTYPVYKFGGTDFLGYVTLTQPLMVVIADTSVPAGTCHFGNIIDANGLNFDNKAAVDCATTIALTATYNNGVNGVDATLTNAGAQVALTVDNFGVGVGARVLVKNQATTYQNGIYVVTVVGNGGANWVLTRAIDFNGSFFVGRIILGSQCYVKSGTINTGRIFRQTTTTTITVGTTAILFDIFAQNIAATFPVIGTTYTTTELDLYRTVEFTNVAGCAVTVDPTVFTNNPGAIAYYTNSAATGQVVFTGATPAITGTNKLNSLLSCFIRGNVANQAVLDGELTS